MPQSFFKFFCILAVSIIPFLARAYYPATLWSSDRIRENLIGIRIGQVVGDGQTDIVTLSPVKLTLNRIGDNRLSKIFEWNAEPGTTWMKLALHDLEGDGIDEIVISGFHHERVQSVIAKIENQELRVLETLPYHLYSISWEGRKILVAQKGLMNDTTGPLLPMVWDGKKLQAKGEIRLPGGLSGKSMSLYSVRGIQMPSLRNGFLYLSPGGSLQYFEGSPGRFKRKWVSGEDYGGSVFYLNRKVRNALNQVEDTRFFVPPSFYGVSPSTAEPMVYIVKNSGYLKNVIGAVPSVRNSQIIRLGWTGYGFQENWNSPRLDGAISDFDLTDWDGDGREEIIATFLLRDRGYVDTLKKQDSLIVVLKP